MSGRLLPFLWTVCLAAVVVGTAQARAQEKMGGSRASVRAIYVEQGLWPSTACLTRTCTGTPLL